MIRYGCVAALLVLSAGCQQGRLPVVIGGPAPTIQASQKAQQRQSFLADVERRVAAARAQPGGLPAETVREMEDMLQTLRRSPNPELLLGAMLAGASPGSQIAEPTPTELHQQGIAAEQLGLKQDAIGLYRRSAAAGNASAAARLRELDSAPTAVAAGVAQPGGPMVPNVARLLTIGPTVSGRAGNPASGGQTPEEAFARAASFEQDNQLERALLLYVDSSQRGHGPASQRLMEIFAYGVPGLTRDYVAAVKYKEIALRQGTQIELLPRR